MKLHLWRSLLLLALLVVSVLTLGLKIGHRDGLVLSAIIALSIIGLFAWYGDWRLLPQLKVREVEGQDPWKIRTSLKELSEKARLPMPRVFLIPNDSPQALAVGRSLGSSKIFLTTGLVQQLDIHEVRAILAYNLMCIKTRATFSFAVASALADGILSVSRFLDLSFVWLFGSRRNRGRASLGPITWLATPVAAGMVRLAVGRLPYLKADQDAAQLLDDKKILAQVLWKMQSYALTQPFPARPAAGHFFIVNPLTMNGLGRYFHAQPEVRYRIKNLIGHYPI